MKFLLQSQSLVIEVAHEGTQWDYRQLLINKGKTQLTGLGDQCSFPFIQSIGPNDLLTCDITHM